MQVPLAPSLDALPGEWPRALRDILASFSTHHPDADVDRIVGAYALAEAAHEGQSRKSGEPYITHPLAVAQMVADLGLDEASVAAALAHDVVEDTSITLEEVSGALGPDVAFLVDGLTKLDRLRAPSPGAAQAATLRKLLVTVAKDVRVLVVKLCDRLHNASTLQYLSREKAARVATETLEVYAPLAHRLGMGEIKWQLEDLSFQTLHPERYEELTRLLDLRAPEREAFLAELVAETEAVLSAGGIPARVTGRSKHLWSIYEKMVIHGKDFDEIHDLVGIRIITNDVKDCYAALGVVHGLWTPVPGRFKDFIATPKFNLYQSVHTTVLTPTGRVVEVQLRTEEMHQRAELGVAAHWGYKDQKRSPRTSSEPDWLTRLLEGSAEDDPEEFMSGLRSELAAEEVVCFTPKGDVITLPAGSTSLDFAYAIHTEVGHRCVGAKVNNRLVPLSTILSPGDTVEVMTSKAESAGPKRDWLSFVATPRARHRIRSWLARESREDAMAEGRAELTRAMRAEALPVKELDESSEVLQKVAHHFRAPSVPELWVAIGKSTTSAKAVAGRVRAELEGRTVTVSPSPQSLSSPATTRRSKAPASSRSVVHVEGMDDVLVRLSQCCEPVPGDDILGYVTKGRGVSIHRTDCINAAHLAKDAERAVDVEWVSTHAAQFSATILVEALDRPGLLADVTSTLTDSGVNISASSSLTGEDQVARQRFTFTLADASHLDSVMNQVRFLDGVYAVHRFTPSS